MRSLLSQMLVPSFPNLSVIVSTLFMNDFKYILFILSFKLINYIFFLKHFCKVKSSMLAISLNLKHIMYIFPKTYYNTQFKLIIMVTLNIQHIMHIFPQTYYNLVCILLVIINLQLKILENSLINLVGLQNVVI